MPLLTFDNVEKSFGGQRLFAGASFAIDAYDHAVLVGRNGCGKTTLLRLIAGDVTPDEGRIARARGRRTWLHEQTPELEHDRPVRDYLMEAFAQILRLEKRLRAAEARLAGLTQDSADLKAAMADFQLRQREFETAGGYHYQVDFDEVLAGLGLPADMVDRDLLTLSGGELTRVTLARALLAQADLLLLDEPTNHLDIDSVEWLEGFLRDYPGAYVLVTHDRRLLERVGSRVLAIEHGAVAMIGADFETYLRERDAGIGLLSRRYLQDQEKVAQLQRYYDRFHAKKDKAKQAKAKLTQMERIKRSMVAPPRAERSLHLGLPQPQPSARVVLELKTPRLTVGEQEHVLVRDLDVVLERGDKVALVGPNGAGKTTLAEVVVGLRALAEGVSYSGHNVRLAYFSQQGRELDDEATILESVLPLAGHDEQVARGLLGRFLFTADEIHKTVGQISGGERSRLRLLALLVGNANFLVLDEPTNHLDLDAVDALATALIEYGGTLLLITHDRYLIDSAAGRVLEIHDGRLSSHLSPERYWEARARRADSTEAAEDVAPSRRGAKAAPAGAARTAAARPSAAEEARRQRARQRALESDVLRLEKLLGELDSRLAEPDTYGDHLVAAQVAGERMRTEERLDELYDEWEASAR